MKLKIHKYLLKAVPLLLLILTTLASNIKSQGVDAVFLLDNSNSVDNNEWSNMSNSTKSLIDQVLGCNPANRIAVVNYSATTSTGAKVYIESNFTNNATTAKNFVRRGGSAPDPSGTGTPGTHGATMGGGTGTYASAGILNDALGGLTNSNVLSTQKVLTRNTSNKTVIFLFTDGRWTDTVGITPAITFANYNTLKTSKNATFVVLSVPENISSLNPDDVSTAAAVASVGGNYNGDVFPNSGDPQGSGVKPRKMVYSTTFDISTLDISTIVSGICSSCAPVVAISALTPPTQTVCLNGVAQLLIATATGTGTLTYQWYSNTSNSTTGGTLISGATSATYNPATTTVGTRYYYVVVSDSYCEGKTTSAIVSVTVTNVAAGPAPVINSTTAYSNATATYTIPCGSTRADLSVLTASNKPLNTIITWHTDPVATATNRINPANAVAGTAKYYAAFYNATGGCYSPTKTITVVAPICAADDDYTATPIIAGIGGTLPSIFGNDTYSGTIISTMPANSVDFNYELWPATGVTVDANGILTIPATLAPGTYVGNFYSICDKDTDILTSSNCSTAEVRFTVVAPPFGCTNTMFLSQTATLYTIGTSSNPFTYPTVGTAAVNYNGIGLNPLDGKIYGMQANSNNLITINADGTYTSLGTVAGLPNTTPVSTYFSGEVDSAGNYYILPNITGGSTRFYKVNLTTKAATLITLSRNVYIPDIAYSVTTGLLYGVDNSASTGQFVTINPSSGVVTNIGAGPGGGNFGAMYTSSTGEVFGIRNDGGFYQFNLTTGERVLISGATASSANDGAHCVTSPIAFNADLSVTKTDGAATYLPGTTTTYTITVSNSAGPYGVLNAQVTDPVPAGIPAANVSYTAVASTGSTTMITGTQTGAINDLVGLPVGGSVTYTVVVNIPANFTGNLTNTVTVTPPTNITDSNTANNTATDTDIYLCGVTDSDADGIFDNCDLDDDNDGILDTAECSNTINDIVNAYSGGTLLNIAPSDFGLTLNQKNRNVTADLSSKFGYPANSGAVIISLTNASVHPTSDSWWTKNGEQPSTWNITGKMSAFVLMAQDTQYYGNDSKTIHINDGAAVIPITVPGMENQIPVAGQWSVSETSTQKTLSDLNTNTSTNEFGNWRYANMNFGPKSFGFSTTVAIANPTYAVMIYLECDADNDGIPNRLDLDSDNDGCTDAVEGDENVTGAQLVTAAGTVTVGTGSGAANQNLCANGSCINANGVPTVVNSGGAADSGSDVGQGVGDSQNTLIKSCFCYAPGVAGSGLPVNHGISALGRAGTDNSSWPMVRQSAWTALEAKTKGFVINRLTTAQIALIPAGNLVEGMMVYNVTLDCLQINTTGTVAGWSCLNTQTCPTN